MAPQPPPLPEEAQRPKRVTAFCFSKGTAFSTPRVSETHGPRFIDTLLPSIGVMYRAFKLPLEAQESRAFAPRLVDPTAATAPRCPARCGFLSWRSRPTRPLQFQARSANCKKKTSAREPARKFSLQNSDSSFSPTAKMSRNRNWLPLPRRAFKGRRPGGLSTPPKREMQEAFCLSRDFHAVGHSEPRDPDDAAIVRDDRDCCARRRRDLEVDEEIGEFPLAVSAQ